MELHCPCLRVVCLETVVTALPNLTAGRIWWTDRRPHRELRWSPESDTSPPTVVRTPCGLVDKHASASEEFLCPLESRAS